MLTSNRIQRILFNTHTFCFCLLVGSYVYGYFNISLMGFSCGDLAKKPVLIRSLLVTGNFLVPHEWWRAHVSNRERDSFLKCCFQQSTRPYWFKLTSTLWQLFRLYADKKVVSIFIFIRRIFKLRC